MFKKLLLTSFMVALVASQALAPAAVLAAPTKQANSALASNHTTPTTPTPAVAPIQSSTPSPSPQPAANTNQQTGLSNLPEIDCNGTGFGLKWILCPTLKIVYRGSFYVFDNMVKPMLEISPLKMSPTEPLMIVWRAIRDFTNALLVLVFLFIIFGNAASIGIDAYSFKKSIPRLIVAAVAIQASFLLTAVVVDLGNVLGSGLEGLAQQSFLQQIGDQLLPAGTPWTTSSQLAMYIVVGGIAAIATAFELWAFLLPLAVVAGFSIVSLLLAVFARQLIISILIVTAPLAIAAWVLPNTEHYFRKWWENLFKAVMMYPIIILLFIMGDTVALVGKAAGGSKEILAMFGPLIAFIMMPAAFKWSGSITAGIASQIRNRVGGYGRAVATPLRQNIQEGRREQGFLNANDEHNRFSGVGRTISRFNALGVGGIIPTKQTKRKTAAGGHSAHHALVSDAQSALLAKDLTSNADLYGLVEDFFSGKSVHSGTGLRLNPYMAEAAMETIAKQGGNVELARLYDGVRDPNTGALIPGRWQGLFDHNTQKWRDLPGANHEKARELWRRGVAIPHGSTYVKSLTHAIHGRGDGAIDGLKGEEFANLHGAAAGIVMQQLVASRPVGDPDRDKALKNFTTSLINIGQSTDRRGRVAKELLFLTKKNASAFSGVTVNVPGKGVMHGDDFINAYIKGDVTKGYQDMEMLGVKET